MANQLFSTKNLSPRQLSAFTAFVLAVPVSILVYLVEHSWLWAVSSFIIISLGAFLLINFILERFIYRKIKLVYKFINRTKATRKEETYYKYVLPQKSIDEVREDVEAWAEENEKELEILRQNEQFRKEFLQNLSHEFKTPVFAIQGYIETLLSGAMADPTVNKKFLEKSARNVDRLTHLLNDLDQISRLERGELTLKRENFVIQDLIREVFDSKLPKSENNQMQLSLKKGCESPLMVYADILASVYNTDGQHILVEISDEGIGIGEKHLSRIFERFYRTDEGRSLDKGGSGLGLAICKHIIEAHGQTIHVRSTENIGTTIGFTLDVKKD